MPLKNRTNSRNNTGCFLSDRILIHPDYIFFPIEKRTQEDCRFTQSVLVSSRTLPIIHSFENGFCTDSSLFCQLRMHEDGARFGLNLQTGRAVPEGAYVVCSFFVKLNVNFNFSRFFSSN